MKSHVRKGIKGFVTTVLKTVTIVRKVWIKKSLKIQDSSSVIKHRMCAWLLLHQFVLDSGYPPLQGAMVCSSPKFCVEPLFS